MSTIKFSAGSIASTATSITVALGGIPAVGDLVVVFLGTNNEIITHQPGWASEFTAVPNPWFEGNILRDQVQREIAGDIAHQHRFAAGFFETDVHD